MQYTFVRESFQPSGDKSPAQAPCAIRFRGQRRERAGCVKSRFTALRSVQIGGTAARVERQYAECPLSPCDEEVALQPVLPQVKLLDTKSKTKKKSEETAVAMKKSVKSSS